MVQRLGNPQLEPNIRLDAETFSAHLATST
jgi:hypothetical protein